MRRPHLSLISSFAVLLAACSGGGTDGTGGSAGSGGSGGGGRPAGFERVACVDISGTCVEVDAGSEAGLITELNSLGDDTTVVLGAGTFELDAPMTIRSATGVTLTGQGINITNLDFASATVQSNGVDVVGDDFTISYVTIRNAKKDGLRIEDSTNVHIHHIKVTWSAGPATSNGAYGIYPVKCTNVLIEDSEAWNASDAGVYVGQVQHAIVRNNIAKQNVAGIEIENTQYADVYGNLAEDNTGGLLIFDLPGNPIVGRDIRVHDNQIVANNRANFAPSGTVSAVPAGTGTLIMASRRVDFFDNTFTNNNSTDIAMVSGLAIEADTGAWTLTRADLAGAAIDDLDLPGDTTTVMNFRLSEIYVHGNTHSGYGTAPDNSDVDKRPIGTLISITYVGTNVDALLYDAIGESAFDPGDAGSNSNDNHICIGTETGATFASLDLENLQNTPSFALLFRPAAPYTPFDCVGFTAGAVAAVNLPIGN